jgi:hypothetical protein
MLVADGVAADRLAVRAGLGVSRRIDGLTYISQVKRNSLQVRLWGEAELQLQIPPSSMFSAKYFSKSMKERISQTSKTRRTKQITTISIGVVS